MLNVKLLRPSKRIGFTNPKSLIEFMDSHLDDIVSVKVIPPKLGSSGFGKTVVFLNNPIIKNEQISTTTTTQLSEVN